MGMAGIFILVGYVSYLFESTNILMFGTCGLMLLLAYLDERRRTKTKIR